MDSSLVFENKNLKEELDMLLWSLHRRQSLNRELFFTKISKGDTDIIAKPGISFKKHSSMGHIYYNTPAKNTKEFNNRRVTNEMEKLRNENVRLKKKLLARRNACYCKRSDHLLAMKSKLKPYKNHAKRRWSQFI